MLVKSRRMTPDTIVFDLENSVAEHRKGTAQGMVLQALQAAPSEGPELAVRINAPSTRRDVAESDLDIVLQSHRVQAVLLPKVEQVEDIEMVASCAARTGSYSATSPLNMIVSIESAASLLHIPTLIEKAKDRLASYDHVARIVALLFASEDYCAATGVRRTRDRRGLLFPRSQLVTIAKAYQLQAIDMVCIEYKDEAYLHEECEEGAMLGFDGKQAIHPAQLDVMRRAFSPSEQDIALAQAIWDAYKQGVAQNKGAVGLTHNGRDVMIDAPMLLQSKRTLRQAGIELVE
ncbi:citrate lyase beta subunit [Malassezia pachydermatis]|uniref:Citrate lyase beta subunit n=1 Tax=Malassezia pachydermatis TaxID=77020 RepID=A0A0M8MUQ1_9BASI|nr:citrate lyase beta subunit [Malassezia pachydermatis]KOS14150.1 citrate lyase beta subunit [Malassezia pachydermatis]